MLLNELRPPRGSVKSPKRLGRGESSGLGKTSGRGHKGQKARAGGYHKVGFEGGQMPLQRRVPKRGFRPLVKKDVAHVNVCDLAIFSPKTEVTEELLHAQGLCRKAKGGVKILGDGEFNVALTVTVSAFSKTAKEKIEKAGGKAVVLSDVRK